GFGEQVGDVLPFDEDRLIGADHRDTDDQDQREDRLACVQQSPHAASLAAPVAAPTIASALHCPRWKRSTMRPSFITRTRSASPITSGSSEDMSTTASPSAASSPMKSWTAALDPTSMPLVGSSSTITFGRVAS